MGGWRYAVPSGSSVRVVKEVMDDECEIDAESMMDCDGWN